MNVDQDTPQPTSAPERQRSTGEVSESHFWVGSRPFFETVLFVLEYEDHLEGEDIALGSGDQIELSNGTDGQKAVGQNALNQKAADSPRSGSFTKSTEVTLFDADGELINSIAVVFPHGEVGMLSLEPFLESAKLESGFRYGRIRVTSNFQACHRCRLSLHSQFSVLEPATLLESGMGEFFPLSIAPHRSLLLAVMNVGSDESLVRCKLFSGNRSPECELVIEPSATRLLLLDGSGEQGLMKIAGMGAADRLAASGKANGSSGVTQHFLEKRTQIDLAQGYLRAHVGSGGPVSLQILDFAEGERAELLHVL